MTGLEPVRHLKFDRMDVTAIEPGKREDEWAELARGEHRLKVLATSILAADDDELEAMLRRSPDLETWMSMLEHYGALHRRTEARVGFYHAIVARLTIVLERIVGFQGDIPSRQAGRRVS